MKEGKNSINSSMSTLMIPGPAGILETRFHAPLGTQPIGKVLLVPPHPEKEGDMDHKVIYSLYRVFASLRFHVLRFNFRGCGKSQGTFSNGEEEISDAATCLDWLASQGSAFSSAQQNIWIAGFSFGSWVSMQVLMRRPECTHFISINPPVHLYDFSFLAPCPKPGLVLHSENDDLTSKESVLRFVHQLSLQRKGEKVDLKLLNGADHHCTDHTKDLENILFQYVRQTLDEDLASDVAYAL
jgi:uncharacterized protein